MNATSRHSILTLPHIPSETTSQNRKKTGYTTYVSHFISDFNRLDYERQKFLLVSNNIHRIYRYDQHEDDPDIYDRPTASSMDKSRLAGKEWNRLSDEIKNGWRERATEVNKLPVLGKIEKLPAQISEAEVLKSMNTDLSKFVSLMHNSVRRGSRIIDSTVCRSFGKERVMVKSKNFRSIFLNHLLKLTYFGVNFSYIRENEISNRTKKTIVIHIHSRDRIEDLFEIAGVSPFSVLEKNDNKKKYGCSGRIILKKKGSRLQVSGYVISESNGGDELEVQLETNEFVNIPAPSFCNESGQWQYGFHPSYDIVEYDPVRIKVQEYGNAQFLFHVYKIDLTTNKLIPISY